MSRLPVDPPLWQRRWSGPVVVVVAALAMFVWTWQTWADVLVDFGVQLYVPWRLTLGEVLYRDIAHYTGPLSVYYNALAMWLFGPSLRAVEFANLPVLVGIAGAIYYLAQRLGGRFCAVVCGLSFVTLFAFAHLTPAGNYNYVCPYEYEYTHATLLCLGCVIFIWRFLKSHRMTHSAIAGLLAGLVFLTRAEFTVAVFAAADAGLTLFTIQRRKTPRLLALGWGSFLIAAAMPAIVSIALLSLKMPASVAARGTLGMWPALLSGGVTSQQFYRHSMGLDDPAKSLRLLGTWCGLYACPIAFLTAWAMLARRRILLPHVVAAALAGALLIGWQWWAHDWLSFFRPLPVVVLGILAIALVQLRRLRGNPREQHHAALAGMLGLLSLLLLGKIFFYSRIIHYGCWLAMPATMLLLITVFGWIPAWLDRLGGAGAIFRAGAGGLWLIVLLSHLTMTAEAIRPLAVSVGEGADQFWADENRGVVVNNALAAVEQIIPAPKTLGCFPEGIMMNYLARRRAPTPYVNYNPPDLLLFGEGKMLSALEKTPPDYILIVHKQTREFGVPFFGRDYGRTLYGWIWDNYQEQPLAGINLGSQPLRDQRFGIRLLIPRR